MKLDSTHKQDHAETVRGAGAQIYEKENMDEMLEDWLQRNLLNNNDQ